MGPGIGRQSSHALARRAGDPCQPGEMHAAGIVDETRAHPWAIRRDDLAKHWHRQSRPMFRQKAVGPEPPGSLAPVTGDGQ